MSFLTRLAQVVGIVTLTAVAIVWAEELGQRHIAPRLAHRRRPAPATARTSPLVDELDPLVPCLTPAGCPSATSCDQRCPLAPTPTGRTR